MDLNTLIKKTIRLRIFYDKNLHTESMRGNIIVVCSVVEALLKDLIESDTSNYKFAVESLKRGKAAYNTFSKAINVSLLIGIINQDMHKALHALRDLRNKLAHGVDVYGSDIIVSEKIKKIALIIDAIGSDEDKWDLHGIAIKVIHRICYDYAGRLGHTLDDVLAKWEPLRIEVIDELAQQINPKGQRTATTY